MKRQLDAREFRERKKILRTRIEAWARRLRVSPRIVRVCWMKHKWGSCSASGTIVFSEALLREQARFQDVVIVHELLHLKVRNHGKLFKALMSAHVGTSHDAVYVDGCGGAKERH